MAVRLWLMARLRASALVVNTCFGFLKLDEWLTYELFFLGSAHPFIKKEWYNVRVPSNFDNSAPTLTPCNKAAGQSK